MTIWVNGNLRARYGKLVNLLWARFLIRIKEIPEQLMNPGAEGFSVQSKRFCYTLSWGFTSIGEESLKQAVHNVKGGK